MASDFKFEPVKKGFRYFVSYKSEDEKRVGEIASALNNRCLPMWYDYGIEKGELWDREIPKNLRDSDSVIMFLTKMTFAKEDTYVQKEYRLANRYHKKIWAVWLDDIDFEKDVNRALDSWYDDLDALQGIKLAGLSVDEVAWHVINDFKLKTGDAPQPATPQYIEQPAPAPAPAPNSAPNSAPKPTPAPAPQPAPLKPRVKVGDIVKFGRYPQGANGEVKPLEWRVLEVQNDTALLLTDKLIDYVPYNEKWKSVTWETCTLRRWMNNDFINKAFTSDEQSSLVVSNNSNPNNPRYGTKGGNATQDRVFALSIPEEQKHFSSSSARKAYTTDYAHAKGWDSKDRSEWWWLRFPGCLTRYAAHVHTDGDISSCGNIVNFHGVAVRLACRIHL